MNAHELSEVMAQDAAGIAAYLLPRGKKASGEWKAGSVDGEEGQSLSVRLTGSKRGLWRDFAKDEGGDLIDLWAAVRGVSIAEAMTEAKAYLGIRDDMPKQREKSYRRPTKPQCHTPKAGVREWLTGRGLTERTIEAFKIGEQVRDGKTFAVFPYLREGELVNAKYRDIADKRGMRQEAGAEPCLFGWHLIDPKTRSIAITEGECFPLDAQVMTPAGWVALGDWSGEMVAQWDGGSLSFVRPIASIRKPFAGHLVRNECRGYVSVTTAEHNLVSIDAKGRHYKHTAACGPRSRSHVIPRCGVMDGPGIALTDAQLALCLAVSADASIDVRKQSYGGGPARNLATQSRYARFGFKKARKIERLRALLEQCGISASDRPIANGYQSICFGLPDFVPGRELPFEWIAQATAAQREFLLAELVHWDGNQVPGRNQSEYSTKLGSNAVWAQTLAHTSGRCSSIIRRSNAHGSWAKVSLLHGKATTSWQRIETSEVAHAGEVACLQVPSGALLVRQEDKISVSGNCDAMTLHQCGIPALSVNAGAGNHQWIESDWERLDRFSEIFVCFDADEAGKKGAKEVIQRLGVDRCKLVKFGAKDANQWLQDGADGEDFHAALKQARPVDPDELVSIADFFGQVKAMLYPAASDEPLPRLMLGDRYEDCFEFRPGELSVWTGINGHGKSLMLSQVQIGVMAQGERVCVFSGEMPPHVQAKRLARQLTGSSRPTPGYIDACEAWIRDRMWLFNVTGSATIPRLLEVFSYAAKRYGIGHFVIDSLMTTDVPDDGPGALSKQKEAIQKLAAFAKSHKAHVHLVAHPRKSRDESEAPGKMDVGGSGKITDGADNVFSVWSDRKEDGDESEKPDALLELHKQRNGEVQHKKFWLFFNKQAQQFCTSSQRRPVAFVPYRQEVSA